ncbi:hypothetical protein M0813_24412 [Anaeramoeba flamelloides]|uniref:Uncharacterized protein n=1 Tax=Anaeramoeba flamelloides TaxID=1746091 RepID=A0ABQ8Y5G3_9EUKA|nr:hypothetical protein M0813_24412 [Anaeramoeba flamelloides]
MRSRLKTIKKKRTNSKILKSQLKLHTQHFQFIFKQEFEKQKKENKKDLDLSGHSSNVLPISSFLNGENMVFWKDLRVLDLSWNRLSSLPKEIEKLRVTSLQIHHNKFATVPPQIFKITTLRNLGLDYNKLSKIPEKLSQLPKLSGLSLRHNNFTKFPFGTIQMQTLIWLSFDDNEIESIPKTFSQIFPNLQYLYFRHNGITSIPSNFWDLQQLKDVYFSDNLIPEIPNGISKCAKLRIFVIDNNLIRKLPQDVIQKQLDLLDVSNNRIKTRPICSSFQVEDRGNLFSHY